MPPVEHVAAGDCEQPRSGIVGQPANTLSSLAYVIAGVTLAMRGRRTGSGDVTGVGVALIVAGMGSVTYHGPGTRLGHVLHDGGLLLLGSRMAWWGRRRRSGWWLAPAAGLVAWGAPRAATPAAVGMISASMLGHPGRRGLAWMAGATVVHTLGRTGGPLCRPESVLQPHALWHVLSAAGIARWALGASKAEIAS